MQRWLFHSEIVGMIICPEASNLAVWVIISSDCLIVNPVCGRLLDNRALTNPLTYLGQRVLFWWWCLRCWCWIPWPCLHPAASDHRSLLSPLSSVSPTILPSLLSPPLPPRRSLVVYTGSGSARGFCLLKGSFSSSLSLMDYSVWSSALGLVSLWFFKCVNCLEITLWTGTLKKM